jgi:hypothetical protein
MRFRLRKGFYKDAFFWIVILVFVLTVVVFTYGF